MVASVILSIKIVPEDPGDFEDGFIELYFNTTGVSASVPNKSIKSWHLLDVCDCTFRFLKPVTQPAPFGMKALVHGMTEGWRQQK